LVVEERGPGGGTAAQPAVDVKSLRAKIGEVTLENVFLEGALTKAGLLCRGLPHEVPKLAVTAVLSRQEDYAALLDARFNELERMECWSLNTSGVNEAR
jgi:hypothetical protein